MSIINSIMTWVMKKRIHQIELFLKYPLEVQQEVYDKLIEQGRTTAFGKEHGFADIKNIEQFRQQVPIRSYEELYPWIDRLLKGENNILWPTEVNWFAKSSGTTNNRSKFIPVTEEAIQECHFKGGKDMLSIYMNLYPDSGLFKGKGMPIGGSQQINQFDTQRKTYYGDLSAVLMKNMPIWAQLARTPSLEITLMEEWEEKIEKLAQATYKENVTSISGVPTWMLLVLQRVLEISGKSSIHEVWPNLEAFFHGAVAFGPYRKLFETLIPNPEMRYMETYNASEGFFGIQDQVGSEELLLMLDYGIYYEFIPMDQINEEEPKVLGLEEVELHKNYALVISTNGGLWRYQIGDTIKFTSTYPYRIKITGRTKHFINAFGEELIIENAEEAISEACEATGAEIDNFTAGPRYLEQYEKGGHEWIIEFKQQPDAHDTFCEVLDAALRRINSDYDAKRQADLALVAPLVHQVPQGTFYRWMKSRGKLGGQNKVPRLSNDREYLDDILVLLQQEA